MHCTLGAHPHLIQGKKFSKNTIFLSNETEPNDVKCIEGLCNIILGAGGGKAPYLPTSIAPEGVVMEQFVCNYYYDATVGSLTSLIPSAGGLNESQKSGNNKELRQKMIMTSAIEDIAHESNSVDASADYLSSALVRDKEWYDSLPSGKRWKCDLCGYYSDTRCKYERHCSSQKHVKEVKAQETQSSLPRSGSLSYKTPLQLSGSKRSDLSDSSDDDEPLIRKAPILKKFKMTKPKNDGTTSGTSGGVGLWVLFTRRYGLPETLSGKQCD